MFTRLTFFVWLILTFIWGSTWLAIKLGLQDLPPFTFSGVRFVVAVLPLLVAVALRRHTIPRKASEWRLIAKTALLTFSINYGLIFWGENYISSGLTAILYTALPLFGLVLAHFHLPEESITWRKIVGVVLGIVGVGIIFSNQVSLDDSSAAWGCLAVVVAACVTAYSGLLIKTQARHIDPIALTTGQMLVGMVPLLLVGAIFEGNPLSFTWGMTSWLAILYLAFVGSSLTFILLYWLIKRIDLTKVQLIPISSTLVAVLLGRWVLGEEMSVRTLIGGASIMIGLLITTLKSRALMRG
jgi:drug/metabolite transporter (DMT)-like permease